MVDVVVVETVLDAAAGRVGQVVVVTTQVLCLEVLMVGRRGRVSVQRVVVAEAVHEEVVLLQAGHVIAVHVQGRGCEGSVVVTSEVGPVWRVGAVEVLGVPVEGDGVGRETESRIDHARRESSHSRSPCVGR